MALTSQLYRFVTAIPASTGTPQARRSPRANLGLDDRGHHPHDQLSGEFWVIVSDEPSP